MIAKERPAASHALSASSASSAPLRELLTTHRYGGPVPYAKLFRSRWAALLWAGGIVWAAADFVGAAPSKPAVAANATAETDAGVDANDLAVLADVMQNN